MSQCLGKTTAQRLSKNYAPKYTARNTFSWRLGMKVSTILFAACGAHMGPGIAGGDSDHRLYLVREQLRN